MIVCSIACCNEHQHKEFNNRKTCLFSLPAELILNNGKRIEKKLTRFKAETQNNQRIAWIKAIKKGYDTEKSSLSFNGQYNNVRLCIRHFHPSTIHINENGKYTLKTGACPTLLLDKCGIVNTMHEETRSLSRFAQSADDDVKLKALENQILSRKFKKSTVDSSFDASFDASADSSFDASVDTSFDASVDIRVDTAGAHAHPIED